MENAVPDDLYAELEKVSSMTEAEVTKAYNSDSKAEILALINADIESLNGEQNEDYDVGMDYDELCRVQGLSRY